MSTFVVQQTLNEDHPESWRALRARAQGLVRVGEISKAAELWERAALLSPMNYTLLVQVGDFYARNGDPERGEAYFRRAIQLAPDLVNAYQLLAARPYSPGPGARGPPHRPWRALKQGGPDRELWALVSESYILKGDLHAAIRARAAAIATDPVAADQWERMADILEEIGEADRASAARARAAALQPERVEAGDVTSGGAP